MAIGSTGDGASVDRQAQGQGDDVKEVCHWDLSGPPLVGATSFWEGFFMKTSTREYTTHTLTDLL